MEKICKYCSEKFVDVSGRWFSNHVRWCDKNPQSHNVDNIVNANKIALIKKFGEFKKFSVMCKKCGSSFLVEEREKIFPKKKKYFCSISCANSKTCSNNTKQKIREKILKNGKNPTYETYVQKRICQNCNVKFKGRRTQLYCSRKCAGAAKRSSTEYLAYKAACKFTFNVWDYGDEFDLDLIYKHGWYKAKNRGDNLGGVSRDHKISVKYGWENSIDPKIISHPANCKLMIHSENVSKHKKCSVLLNELEESIEKWNNKYGKPKNIPLFKIPNVKCEQKIKNIEDVKFICNKCGKKLKANSIFCRECRSQENRWVDWPSKEELEKLLWEKPAIQLAKEFGVSDAAISNWAKFYGLQKPPRGYWNKVKFGKL